MGGGDLNAKKAWHPNTLKNQERVWKAEQAAAEEKKRIVELERERQMERDRAELNKLVKYNLGPPGTSNDNRLHWMYEKPDKQVQQEEYLLGKAIDSNNKQAGKSEADEIPAVARRVVGSSMLALSGDTQVDLVRKLREDPLLLVKERERAARAALLNNPVQRAKLTEMLRKDRENKKEGKSKRKTKKGKDLDNMLAEKLQALNSQNGINLASLLASDDSSSDSSNDKVKKKERKGKSVKKASNSDTESEEEKYVKSKCDYKKKDKKCNISSKKRRASESDDESYGKKKRRDRFVEKAKGHREDSDDSGESSDDEQSRDDRKSKHNRQSKSNRESKGKHQNPSDSRQTEGDRYWSHKQHSYDERYTKSERKTDENRYRRERGQSKDENYARANRQTRDSRHASEDRSRHDGHSRDDRSSRHNYNDDKEKAHKFYGSNATSSNDREWKTNKRSKLSEEDKAAKLAEMVAAGAEREKQRESRVAEQLDENERAEKHHIAHSRSSNIVRQLPDSLESRIHSNRHYIQRDQRHMNENFARR